MRQFAKHIILGRVFRTLGRRKIASLRWQNLGLFLDPRKALGEQSLMFNRLFQKGFYRGRYLSAMEVTFEKHHE